MGRKAPKLRMKKRRIVKPDGRYLIFYEFEEERPQRKGGSKGKTCASKPRVPGRG